MKIQVLKLGTVCTDKATALKGTLTHWVINMGKQIRYVFQPEGLDDHGQPVKALYFEETRLNIKEKDFEEVDIPFDILGTIVTDKPSGFTGTAIEFIRHINGCFHVMIQPKGILPKTKLPIEKCDFDLRECTGDKIKQLSKKNLKKVRKKPRHLTEKTVYMWNRHRSSNKNKK